MVFSGLFQGRKFCSCEDDAAADERCVGTASGCEELLEDRCFSNKSMKPAEPAEEAGPRDGFIGLPVGVSERDVSVESPAEAVIASPHLYG